MSLALSAHPNFEKSRTAMVLSQLAPSGVRDERVLAAYQGIPREIFVPHALQGVAYVDEDIPLERERCLLAPLVHGQMVEAAAIGPEDKVLDIGGATGYSAAVLSCLARSVVALDQDTDFLKSAQSDWTSLGLTSISPVVGPHIWGAAGQGPFDVIFINGAVARVPEALLDQLAAGGRLVCLLVPEGDLVGALVCFTKLANGQIVHEVVADAVNRDYLAGFGPPAGFTL
jgi:protein-L-isoaspartate(D-aspartate) O-methyltransferase